MCQTTPGADYFTMIKLKRKTFKHEYIVLYSTSHIPTYGRHPLNNRNLIYLSSPLFIIISSLEYIIFIFSSLNKIMRCN